MELKRMWAFVIVVWSQIFFLAPIYRNLRKVGVGRWKALKFILECDVMEIHRLYLRSDLLANRRKKEEV